MAATQATNTTPHIPVLLAEVLDALKPQDLGIYVDGTFGRGGYTRATLDAADCQVWAIDRDPDARPHAQAIESDYPNRFHFLTGCFGDMADLLNAHDIDRVTGVMLDIGVSSVQLDQADRGFSFREDGPLDMRMGKTGQTAADVVNAFEEKELADIIYKYGEERASRAVARTIINARAEAPITRTGQLADLVRSVVRSPRKKGGKAPIDPATRTFQALRIYVNDELGELERGLQAAEELLSPGGHLAVVTFHSLEDRIVKNFLKERCGTSGSQSRRLPGEPPAETREPSFRLITRKPVGPTKDEARTNPRSRSARLRAAERTNAPVWQPREAA